MSHLTVLVFCESEARHEDLARELEATGQTRAVGEVSDLSALTKAVEAVRPDVLMLELPDSEHKVLDVVEKLPAPAPALLVCGRETASDVILRAMRLGAEEYLTLPLRRIDLHAAVDRVSARTQANPPPGHLGSTLAVMGAKGGVGATTVATQLGISLAELGGHTALVDLDLSGGDVAFHFDLESRFSLADVAARRELDQTYVESLMESVSPNLSLLCAPSKPEDGERVSVPHLERVLALLRGAHNFVVLDLPSQLGELTVRGLELADQVLMVTSSEVASLVQARKRLALLERMGFDLGRVRLVRNRVDRRNPMSEREVQTFLNHKIAHSLPNDYAAVQESQNTGRLLAEVAPGGRLTTESQNLALEAHDWLGLPHPEMQPAAGAVDRVVSYLRSTFHGAD